MRKCLRLAFSLYPCTAFDRRDTHKSTDNNALVNEGQMLCRQFTLFVLSISAFKCSGDHTSKPTATLACLSPHRMSMCTKTSQSVPTTISDRCNSAAPVRLLSSSCTSGNSRNSWRACFTEAAYTRPCHGLPAPATHRTRLWPTSATCTICCFCGSVGTTPSLFSHLRTATLKGSRFARTPATLGAGCARDAVARKESFVWVQLWHSI